jgi:hypothetical protein
MIVCVCVRVANHFVLQGATDAFRTVCIQVCCNVLLRLDDVLHTRRSRCLSRAGRIIIFQFRATLGRLIPPAVTSSTLTLPPSCPSAKKKAIGGDMSK